MALRTSHRSALLVSLSMACAMACASSARAAQITWNGASSPASTSWSNGGNWVGGVAPQAGVDGIVFDGSAVTTNVNDFAAGTQINGITWNNTGTASWTHTPVATGGNSINLAGDLVYSRTSLTANLGSSTLAQPVALVQNINVDVAGGGTLQRFGVTSGAFSVTKTGAGLYVSNSADTFSGGLNVNGGTYRGVLAGNTTASFGTGTISLSNGAGLELRNTGTVTLNNALNLGTGGGTVFSRAGTVFNPSAITGTGQLTLSGSGAASYTITPNSFVNWSGQVNATIGSGSTLTIRLATAYVNNSAINVGLDLGGAGTVNVTRQAGTNISPGAVADIGALSGGATSSIGGSAAGTGYFIYSIGSLNTSTTFAGNVIDGGTRTALRKVGTGTLTLSGTASTFSGPSSIDGGTLNVTGALTGANLVLTVNAGGTLGGSGTITGTVNSVGGAIAPGTSPGTLTVGGLTLNSASILNYELNGGNTTVGGSINDLINVTTAGGLTLNGTLNVSETVAGSFASSAGGTWRLINYTGTLAGSGLTLGTIPTLPSGASFSIDTATAGQVNLVLTVPEPTSLLVLGAAGLIAMKRRR